ncbi:hypothetical protein [Carboxylicivirga taeanensis]|uniref:hypothetical protein n=1 Tax=Carboxylicivirga taeanensis TaxID=1416875 RepID=UPI003F6E0D1C
MKIDLFTILLITLIACASKAASATTIADSLNTEKPNKIITYLEPTESRSDIKDINWTNFELVFKYEDKKEEFVQILGINNIDTDTIEYQIYMNSMLCVSEFYGHAIKHHPNGGLETDEDDAGAYPVIEYLFNDDDYDISIRIDSEKHSKARFILSPDREIDECDPFEHLIMKNSRQ